MALFYLTRAFRHCEALGLNLSALVLEEKGAFRSPFHYSQVTLASTPTRVHVQIYSISMAEIFECCRLSREGDAEEATAAEAFTNPLPRSCGH